MEVIYFVTDSHLDSHRSQHLAAEHEADNTAPSVPTACTQQCADACPIAGVRRTRSIPRTTNNWRKSGTSYSSS